MKLFWDFQAHKSGIMEKRQGAAATKEAHVSLESRLQEKRGPGFSWEGPNNGVCIKWLGREEACCPKYVWFWALAEDWAVWKTHGTSNVPQSLFQYFRLDDTHTSPNLQSYTLYILHSMSLSVGVNTLEAKVKGGVYLGRGERTHQWRVWFPAARWGPQSHATPDPRHSIPFSKLCRSLPSHTHVQITIIKNNSKSYLKCMF